MSYDDARKMFTDVEPGAGAGVSTEMLWRLGYRNIVAVDWSDAAWTR